MKGTVGYSSWDFLSTVVARSSESRTGADCLLFLTLQFCFAKPVLKNTTYTAVCWSKKQGKHIQHFPMLILWFYISQLTAPQHIGFIFKFCDPPAAGVNVCPCQMNFVFVVPNELLDQTHLRAAYARAYNIYIYIYIYIVFHIPTFLARPTRMPHASPSVWLNHIQLNWVYGWIIERIWALFKFIPSSPPDDQFDSHESRASLLQHSAVFVLTLYYLPISPFSKISAATD